MFALLNQALPAVTYSIPSDPLSYRLDIKMKGFVPLFGLNQAEVELQAGLKVTGLPPEGDTNPRATTDIDSLRVILNGAVLPFSKDNVSQYFPNTVTLTPQGKVLKNNAPNVEMAVHLPGLDIKRFPDITFLAIEFPTTEIDLNKSWSYSREFGDSKVDYTVTPVASSGDTLSLEVKMSQEYEEKEGDSFEAVKNSKDATYDVKTDVNGTGKVEFDLKRGLVRKFHLDADAVGNVTEIGSGKTSKRDLKTTMDVSLK
jgi:hypothetical protein